MWQQQYSPDFSPSKYILFLKVQNEVRGYHFQYYNNLKNNLTGKLKPLKAVPHVT
jgi:hypothetical protein